MVLLEVQMHAKPGFKHRLGAQSLRFLQLHPQVQHLAVVVVVPHWRLKLGPAQLPLAHPVHWRSAPIPRGAYPCADGHSWAEPDLEHAAELCRAVAAQRLALAADPPAVDPSRDPAVLASYRARPEELWANREGVSARMRWRANRSLVGW